MKINALPLSNIVRVGVYRFEKYEILGDEPRQRKGTIVGHNEKPFEKDCPIEPTEVITIDDRTFLDSLLILASKALPISGEKSNRLILSWCMKHGLPACSIDASQETRHFAFPLYRFYDFLFALRDAFWKADSMYEDFSIEHGTKIENPYKQHNYYLTKLFPEEKKQELITEFINDANFNLCFEYMDGKPTLYNYAKDIISLAQYQLGLTLLSNGECVPRHCKCCGSMFFAYRKNQLYGPCCTRQKRYAAEKRKREKASKATK